MLMFKPVKLKCFELVKEEVTRLMARYDTESKYVIRLKLSDETMDAVNEELTAKGFSKVEPPLAFKKQNLFIQDYRYCHVDYGATASLIMPIYGCENTTQYWYSGDYELTEINIPGNVPLYSVHWNKPGEFLTEVEIKDQPFLCRVDVPHSIKTITSPARYRLTCTFRFLDQIPYDQACELFDKE